MGYPHCSHFYCQSSHTNLTEDLNPQLKLVTIHLSQRDEQLGRPGYLVNAGKELAQGCYEMALIDTFIRRAGRKLKKVKKHQSYKSIHVKKKIICYSWELSVNVTQCLCFVI
jgi:hypothetical protein